ncbi:hypothetical protein [Enterococcus asini]|uniref:hypothetical protein n=1 Tax=Enterococcus asini TaxID=57732 RepID=UPI0026DC2026|nr:hypothetical protein [Enterococcus asini]
MSKKQYRKTKGELADLKGQVIETVSIYGQPVKGKVVNVLENTLIVNDGHEAYVVHKESLEKGFERGDWTYRYKPNAERFDLRGCQTFGQRSDVRASKKFYGW